MQDLLPGQCVIVIGKSAFRIVAGNVWIDNLHFVIALEFVAPTITAVSLQYPSGPFALVGPFASKSMRQNVFMTRITFQSSWRVAAQALNIFQTVGQPSVEDLPLDVGKGVFGYVLGRAVLFEGVIHKIRPLCYLNNCVMARASKCTLHCS
jgi:hypothetical protein